MDNYEGKSIQTINGKGKDKQKKTNKKLKFDNVLKNKIVPAHYWNHLLN